MRQPERLTFFIDECLGRRAVPEALRAAGHEVILLSDRFQADVDDEVWLSALFEYRRDWIILTKDTRIRTRSLERLAFIAAGLRVFALTSGDLNGENQAQAFVNGLKRIARLSKQAGPFIAIVSGSGRVAMLEQPKPTRDQKRRHRRAPKQVVHGRGH